MTNAKEPVTATTRDQGFAKLIVVIFEGLGILNKGSASAPATKEAGASDSVEPISSNALNVTRVGGVATLISGAGAAALAIFSVNKEKDPAAIVVAAYAGVALIVAAALVTVAIIIAADIRARGAIATATPAGAVPAATVKVISGAKAANVTLDRTYQHVLVTADDGDVAITLPSAKSSQWQSLEVRRIDTTPAHTVTVRPVEGSPGERLELESTLPGLTLYSTGEAWLVL